MKINLHFPGQGAQFKTMGLDFYEKYKTYRDLIDEAGIICKTDLVSVLNDEEKLNETENAQVAIFTMSYGIAQILREEGYAADNVLGLSLGEYGALTYAGVIDREDTMRLLKRRSYLMQKASMENRGFLAAVSFMPRDAVREALRGLSGVTISNLNAENQNVVGGKIELKEEFEKRIRAHGGKKITFLNVSGAFHTPLMESAAVKFKDDLELFTFNHPKVPVLSNFKGDFYSEEDSIKEILMKHIHKPVMLDSCLFKLESGDEDIHILLGPGKALGSILKQNKIKGRVFTVNDVGDLEETARRIKEIQNGK